MSKQTRPPVASGKAGDDTSRVFQLNNVSPPANQELLSLTGADLAIGFLQWLRPHGQWVLVAIDADTQAIIALTFTDEGAAREFVEQWNGTRNLYYSLNPVRRLMFSKPAKVDVSCIEFMHADLDAKDDELPEQAKKRYLNKLNGSTALIDSGNGLQVLWRLDNPIELGELVKVAKGKMDLSDPDKAVIADIEGRMKAMMKRLDSPVGTQNIDRILRLPGTINIPNKAKLTKGRVRCESKLAAINDTTYRLEHFPVWSADPEPQTIQPEEEDELARTIRDGGENRHGDSRSEQQFYVACEMVRRGYIRAAIESTLLDKRNCISDHIYDQSNPVAYAKRQVDNAIAKVRAEQASDQSSSLLFTSADFVADFVPPDYLVDGLLQRRFIYALTAPTGTGKTSLLLLLAAHVALGRQLAGRDLERGKVLYFAGENPDDVRMRWMKQCADLKLRPNEIDVVFLPGTPAIDNKQVRAKIDQEVAKLGPFSLVIVDTAAAYFHGDDENGMQLKAHAQMLRTFTTLPGGPTILVACHPVKAYDLNKLVSRGAGLFINEIDGNLTLMKDPTTLIITLHWYQKMRGVEFEPICFRLVTGFCDDLKDSKGRHIPTITAEPMSSEEREAVEEISRDREIQLLKVMNEKPDASFRDLAETLGWFYKTGGPDISKVHRLMDNLEKSGLVKKKRNGKYEVTDKGRDKIAEAALPIIDVPGLVKTMEAKQGGKPWHK